MALTETIKKRGLTLNQIKRRLDERGTTISVAALSYWMSGSRVPTRDSSMQAVVKLESILNLPQGSLSRLVESEHNLRKGRVAPTPTLTDRYLELWDTVSARDERPLLHLSRHDRVQVNSRNRPKKVWTRLLVRAERNLAQRTVVAHKISTEITGVPKAGEPSGCLVTECALAPEHQVLLVELTLPRPLDKGDVAMLEYSVTEELPTGEEVAFTERHNGHVQFFHHPLRLYVVELDFDAATRPRKYHPVRAMARCGKEIREQQVGVDSEGNGCLVVLDPGPGLHGVHWFW